jgi:AraC family transcriptional regulator
MFLRIDTMPEKKLVGKSLKMSLAQNRTGDLWRSFMLQRKEIRNTIGADLYSMQIYSPSYFNNFSPGNEFEKWATIEVGSFNDVPEGMETFNLPTGLYAVFLHLAARAPKHFNISLPNGSQTQIICLITTRTLKY